MSTSVVTDVDQVLLQLGRLKPHMREEVESELSAVTLYALVNLAIEYGRSNAGVRA